MSKEFGWRRFTFFDKSFVVDPGSGEKNVVLKDVSVDTWCKSGDTVFIGEKKGGIFRITSHFEHSLTYWKAFQKTLVDLKSAQGLLFSAGDDDNTGSVLKIWHKIKETQPEVIRTVRFTSISSPLSGTVTSIAVHSQMTEVVAGFSDGTVLMFQGEILKDKIERASRWLKICEHNNAEGGVEGVAVSHLPGDKIVVFVIFSKNMFSYVIENKAVKSKVQHKTNGDVRNCWAFNDKLGQLVVAYKEMVDVYDAEGSTDSEGYGRCYQLGRGFEKLQVIWLGEYLVLLTKQEAVISTAGEKFMSVVTIYDIKNQYVAFSCSFPAICRLFIHGQTLMVLNNKDGTLSELKENTLSRKLEILFKKKFFDVALILAKNSKEGQLHEQAIHSKYADYLYAKGDFDNAIDHYKETIGLLEPSYVMKRFHDESRLQQLCFYLEALHEKNVFNKYQTKILLQTYARLGKKEKLLSFVQNMGKKNEQNPDSDMVSAFHILREAGLSKEASFLAIKLVLPDEALACMIEDLRQYSPAVKYLGNLPPEQAIRMMEKYGKALMLNCPDKIIPLLKTILQAACDGEYDLTHFLSPFFDTLSEDSDFIEFILQLPSNKKQSIIDGLLEVRLRKLTEESTITDEIVALGDAATPDIALQLVRVFRCLKMEHRILEKSGSENDLARFLLKHGALNQLITKCRKQNNPKMWLDTMVCIAQRSDITEEELKKFLIEVDKSESIHPLLVLEILSGSETIKISAVKPYIINWLHKQNVQIEKNAKAVEEAEKRMREVTQLSESLKFEPQVIQVNKCSACDTPLQLPAVHFLCKHSYHVHCFESYSEKADNCPACVPQQISQDEGHYFGYNKFQEQLNTEANGMEIVAKFIRMGLFDNYRNKQQSRLSNTGSHLLSDRQNSDDRSSQPYEPGAQRRQTVRSTNPFDETPVRPAHSKNPFDESSPPRASTNPFDE